MTTMLKVDNVSIAYGKTEVVHQSSFTLTEGEIGCLLGSSGCGKTTLLRAIAGFEPVTHGTIHIADKLLSDPKLLTPPEQRQIGMVFQDFTLFPHLNVAANVAFGLNGNSKDNQERVNELLELVRLPDYGERYPHELSGGQQQRIALARAIAPRPRLLLLDEPFSSLDTHHRRKLAFEVANILRQEKITSLLVTHDQREAFTVADNIGVMDSGNIMQWDSANNIHTAPVNKTVASFITRGRWLSGTVTADGKADTIFGLVDLNQSTLAEGTKVDCLVRSRDLVVDANSPHQATVIGSSFAGNFTRYRIKAGNNTFMLTSSGETHYENGIDIGIRYHPQNLVYFTQ